MCRVTTVSELHDLGFIAQSAMSQLPRHTVAGWRLGVFVPTKEVDCGALDAAFSRQELFRCRVSVGRETAGNAAWNWQAPGG